MATVEKVEKIKVAAYCRVSTDAENQRNSFEAQMAYFNRELNQRENQELFKVYADRGISGVKLLKSRDEFDKMLYDAGLDIKEVKNELNHVKYVTIPNGKRQPKFKYIYVKDTSRFARNVKVYDILDELKSNRVYVIFLDYDLSTEREEDLDRIRTFFNMAEWESRLKSKKTKWGFDEAIRKGDKIHTSGKLYGYQYIQADNRLEKIPEEAAVVKQIFELYSQRIGVRRIANMLTEQGIFTRNGEPFCKSTIMRILSNEKYKGVSNRGKYDTGLIFNNKNTYAKVKDDYRLTETDKIPAIIERELFDKCKQQMESKVNHVNKKGVYSGLSEYTGLLYCSKCGSVYYSNYYRDKRTGYEYDKYICSKQKLHGKKACDGKVVETKDIDVFFEEMMTQNFAVQVRYDWEQTIQKLTNLQYFLMGKILNDDAEQINNVKEQIAELNEQKQMLFALYLSKKFVNPESVTTQINEFDIKLQQLHSVHQDLTKNPIEFIEMVNRTKANIEAIRNIKLVNIPVNPKITDGFDDFITKEFYTKQEVMECIGRIVVNQTKKGDLSLSLDAMSTTKKYQQYIETFGYDLDSLESLSDDDRISLEQKYLKILEIYQ